jgi:hypothetical protein
MTDYFSVNRANWEERASIHAASDDYGFARFVADPQHLSTVVAFDRPRLGDISGLRGVHLQCHIGTDTLSLARLGARMSGLDFSGVSLAAARKLAADTATEIDTTKRTSTTRSRCSARRPSNSSIPGSARCAGCRARIAGPLSWPGC